MLVDRLAYQSAWRFIHPGEKLIFFLVLVVWGFLPFPWVHLGLLGLFPLLFLWSGIPLRFFVRLLWGPLFFIIPGVLVVVFSSRGNFEEGWRLALRSMLLVNSFLWLASTTPIPDLLGFLRNFRILRVVTDIALLTYRYLFVFSKRAEEVHRAQEARLGYRSYWQGLRSMAFLVGSLFFYAFQAMEQFRLSLEARGFEGELAVLPPEFRPLGIKRISLFLGVGIGGLFLVLSGRLWR